MPTITTTNKPEDYRTTTITHLPTTTKVATTSIKLTTTTTTHVTTTTCAPTTTYVPTTTHIPTTTCAPTTTQIMYGIVNEDNSIEIMNVSNGNYVLAYVDSEDHLLKNYSEISEIKQI